MDDFKFVVKKLRVYDNEDRYTKIDFLKVFTSGFEAWKCYNNICEDTPTERPNNCYFEITLERYLVVDGLSVHISTDEIWLNDNEEFTGAWE